MQNQEKYKNKPIVIPMLTVLTFKHWRAFKVLYTVFFIYTMQYT
jgi:hypothetical protein